LAAIILWGDYRNIENLSQEELKNLKKGVLAYKVNNKDESVIPPYNRTRQN
jgi:hypothetical protein